MTIIDILEEINAFIQEIEGEIDYDKWHITLSGKEIRQFKYDAPLHMEHVKEIGKIDADSIEDLMTELDAMQIECKVEPEPTTVYLFKTLA